MTGTRAVDFLKSLWKYRRQVRSLLASENYIFARDYPPGHFYSPLPDLAEVRRNESVVFDVARKPLPGVDLNEARQTEMLNAFAGFYGELSLPEQKTSGFRYHFDNSFYSYGDGVTLYSMLRWLKPRRIVEAGSGFSSAEMLDVNERYLRGTVEFTFIEPHPERLHSLLSEKDREKIRIEVDIVQNVDEAAFRELESGDILFIDSSHVGKIHSDVLYILFEVLPILRDGVIVHFHDILWPFEYPKKWIEGGRAWNEAYLLRSFLQYNSAFEILYFNSFMALHHREEVERAMPLAMKVPSDPETIGNSSLWLRKVSDGSAKTVSIR